MSIKVSIVEDDTKIRESLAILINGAKGFSCLRTFPNAEVAIKQLPDEWPDLLLMDINLPRMSGIDCVKKLKTLRPELLIMMLTNYEDEEQIFSSLMAGASGYLTKQAAPAEILEALDDLHNGGSPMSNSIARKVVQHFHHAQKETENLTNREREILACLSKGYQYKEIADQLAISALTVRNHIRNIYEKLHVRTRTEAVVKFLGKNPLH